MFIKGILAYGIEAYLDPQTNAVERGYPGDAVGPHFASNAKALLDWRGYDKNSREMHEILQA